MQCNVHPPRYARLPASVFIDLLYWDYFTHGTTQSFGKLIIDAPSLHPSVVQAGAFGSVTYHSVNVDF